MHGWDDRAKHGDLRSRARSRRCALGIHLLLGEFVRILGAAASVAELALALEEITRQMGFSRYALTHHVDIQSAPQPAIRLHNYPDEWVEYFDRHRLGTSDPIHRAAQVTSVGFDWARLDRMIRLTADDRRILTMARDHGLIDGFTVPANVPGEARGSCSFVYAPGDTADPAALPVAQLAGAFGFEAARRIWRMRHGATLAPPTITERQRDCLLWVARGKTDWEISRILGVSQETVIQHMKQARDRYGVQKRTSLLIRALFDGTISFADILPR